ncbi:hypothetical protein B0H17DRAFT_1183561 [Mycena rosella]|uniref:Cupredoxin n=1 Tax=Mycena rosella TaxID=1033263 RepID=A0AAD7G940_MYCRO|nr:hypothetical protein B0H17DRAFT_1183561 [Mycena rosella]
MSISALATLAFAAMLPAALAQSTITVQVGPSASLVYDPPSVTASAGDIIEFVFNPKNHTVTQSSFDAPCVALPGGGTSGFQFVSNASALLPRWPFTLANDEPAYFYCQQTGHCGKGMVFTINAPADPDPAGFSAFQARAEQLNSTGSASAAPPPATSSAYTTPAAQSWATATATVTHDSSTWTSVYTSYDGTPSPTYAATPVDHKIAVGIDGLTYTPSNISASIGDTVTFEFHPKNHTVTQSSFLQPCSALGETSTTGQVGFKSGFQFVAANATDFPTFQITVNDTAPIWGYCGQVGHCAQGMVFSINAVESGPNNFNAFQQLAMRTNSSGTSSNGTSSNGTATGTGAAPGASKPGGARAGKQVGVAAVALAVVAGLGALL